MMMKALCAVLLTANMAAAADFCGVTTDQRHAVPQGIAGSWLGTARSGLMVDADGKPQVLDPADQEELEITLKADGIDVTIAEDLDFFPEMTLKAFTVEVMSEPDFALPGESPLGAAELLAPEVKEAGIACNAKDLPQFLGDARVDDTYDATFRLFALSPDRLVLVIHGESGKQVARAVIDLTRGTMAN